MRIGYHQQIELLQPFHRLRNAGDAVAGVALHEHRPDVVLLGNLIFGQQNRVKPARQRNARRLHVGLRLEARLQPGVVRLPDARPMPPGAFDQAVVERQRHDIETDVGGALHVVVAAEDIGAVARTADIAGQQQRNATRPHVGGADRVLGLAHAPDQRRRLLRREHLGDAFELSARNAGYALNFLGRPLFYFLARVFEAVDALFDEFLVFPAVLEDVPHHPVEHRNVGARAEPNVFGGMRGGARQARIDDDDVRLVEFGAFNEMLQRHRMGFGRIAAHDDLRLRIPDVVEAIGHRAVAPGIGHAGDGG